MKLFIDADYIVYKSCASAETEIDWGDDVILVTSKFSDAMRNVKRDIVDITLEFGGFAQPVLFFSDSKNFRKEILPTYKGHRNRKKPCGYKRVINELMNEYRVIQMPMMPWVSTQLSIQVISLYLLTRICVRFLVSYTI